MTAIVNTFYMTSPDAMSWSLHYGLGNLPVGFKCRSITAQIADLAMTRQYGAKNASTTDGAWIEFDADHSKLGVRLIGPDGVTYATHELGVPPFTLMLAPGELRRYGLPYDWNSYQSDGQSNAGQAKTTLVPEGSFEGPAGVWPAPHVWRMELDEQFHKIVHAGVARTDAKRVISARCIVQFNQ